MKIFLSVPSTTSDEDRLKLLYMLENDGHKVTCPIFVGDWWSEASMKARGIKDCSLNIFAETLRDISNCDAIFFGRGWENDTICKMEHDAVAHYNITTIMFEENKE